MQKCWRTLFLDQSGLCLRLLCSPPRASSGFSLSNPRLFWCFSVFLNDEKCSFYKIKKKIDLGLRRVQNRLNFDKICFTSVAASSSQCRYTELLFFRAKMLVLRCPWLTLWHHLGANFWQLQPIKLWLLPFSPWSPFLVRMATKQPY